jgi:hypothetical protein
LITVLKVFGTVAVAGLGTYGSIKSTQASSEITRTIEILKATADRIDVEVIPRLRKRLDRLQDDNKALAETAATLRERLARLEGKLERPRPTSGGSMVTVLSAPKVGPEEKNLDKILKRKPVNIPDVDFDGVQMMVQKAGE